MNEMDEFQLRVNVSLLEVIQSHNTLQNDTNVLPVIQPMTVMLITPVIGLTCANGSCQILVLSDDFGNGLDTMCIHANNSL